MERLNLERLRQARIDCGLSMAKIGKLIGKDRTTIWRYENGQTQIAADILYKLLNIYGVSIKDVTDTVPEDTQAA